MTQPRAPERRIGAVASLRRWWNGANFRRGGFVVALALVIAALTWLTIARGPAAGRRAARLLHDGAERATALFDRVLPWRENAPTQPLVPSETGSATGRGPSPRSPVTPLQTGPGRSGGVPSAHPIGRDATRVDDRSDLLGGARWGMTVQGVLAALPHKVVRVDARPAGARGGLVTSAAVPRVRVGRSTFTVEFLFDASGRLRAIELRPVDADDPLAFDELAAWVSSRHGAPRPAGEGAAGDRASSRRARWLTSTSVIDVQSTAGDSNQSGVRALHAGTAAVGSSDARGARLIYSPRAEGH